MTSNQIEAMKARESKRHNKETEAQGRYDNETKRKDYRRKVAKDVVDSTLGLGNLGAKVAFNDPTWYDANPEATKAAANISWLTPLGTEIKPASRLARFASATGYVQRVAAPGLMTLNFIPTIGDPDNFNIMVAANKIYSWVRHTNSGSRNYEAVDYMLFLLAADSLVTNFAFAKKIYRAYVTFSGTNRYLGQAVLRASGISDATIQSETRDLARTRSRYNQLISQFNALNIPAVFNYITRHGWMASHLWWDEPGDNGRAQFYQFNPRGYFNFKATKETSDEAGALQFSNFDGSLTLTSLLNIIQDQLNDLLSIEDFGIMSGDSLKAFGADKMAKLDMMPEWDPLVPTYSEEVLSQICAATIFGENVAEAYSFFQKNGKLYQGPIAGSTSPEQLRPIVRVSASDDSEFQYPIPNAALFEELDGRIINAYYDNQTPRDVMVTTALTATYGPLEIKPGSNAGSYRYVASVRNYGSEIITSAAITTYVSTSPAEEMKLVSFKFSDKVILPYSPASSLTNYVLDGSFGFWYTSFDWAPNITIFQRTTQSSSGLLRVVFSSVDLKRPAVVENSTLQNIHTTALYSLFAIPNSVTTTKY